MTNEEFARKIAEEWYNTDTDESLEEFAYNKAIDDCLKKLDELERHYTTCYGVAIIEMYADKHSDFIEWLKAGGKNE